MRTVSQKSLIQQARDFYRETRYIPSNYDVLFHTDSFSSPVTIRKYFGSWEEYLDKAFDVMVMNNLNRMFYGGYNRNFSITLPDVIDPNIFVNSETIDILGKLTYEDLYPKEVWVLKQRWIDIIKIMMGMDISVNIIPAEKRFLTPFALIGDKYAIVSVDTPHIKNHYKRTSKVTEYLNANYEVINLNGVKKNHMQKAIERMME